MKRFFLLIGFSIIAIVTNAQSFEQPQQFVYKAAPDFNSIASLRTISYPDTIGIVNDTDDTDFSPTFDLSTGHPSLYTFSQGTVASGYVYGNNGSPNNFTEVAQGYQNNYHQDISIAGVLCWFGAKQSDMGSDTTSKVVIKIYNMDAAMAYNIDTGVFNTTHLNWPGPSVLRDSADLLFSAIDTFSFLYVPFIDSTWIWASSDFAIGCDFTHLAAGDTVGLMSDKKNDALNKDYAFHHTANGKWFASDELFSGIAATGGLDNEIALWAVVTPTTGVNEFYNGMKLTAYPNPSVDKATIEYKLEKDSKNVSLLVIDPSGKKVQENTFGNLPAGNYSMNLQTNHLAAGTYFYQLRANGQMVTKQFIVSK